MGRSSLLEEITSNCQGGQRVFDLVHFHFVERLDLACEEKNTGLTPLVCPAIATAPPTHDDQQHLPAADTGSLLHLTLVGAGV